jgi:hypothetical protein
MAEQNGMQNGSVSGQNGPEWQNGMAEWSLRNTVQYCPNASGRGVADENIICYTVNRFAEISV